MESYFKYTKRAAIIFIVAILLPICGASYGLSVDLNSMLSALKDNAEPIIKFTMATAYVIGFWFIVSAIADIKKVGQSISSQQQMGVSGPVVKMVIGALLLYLPSTIDVGIVTFWGSEGSNVVSYVADSGDLFAPIKEGAVAIVRVIGYISLVRGLVILSKSVEQGTQQGTFSKGITHVIGGILAINVVGTIRIIGNSLGIDII